MSTEMAAKDARERQQHYISAANPVHIKQEACGISNVNFRLWEKRLAMQVITCQRIKLVEIEAYTKTRL